MSKHEHHPMFKNLISKLSFIFATVICSVLMTISVAAPTNAATVCQCTNTYSDGKVKIEQGSDASLFGDSNNCYCGGTANLIRTGLNIFTAGIGILGTVGIIIAGVMYMSARDDEGRATMAKRRILQIAVGIAAFVLFDVAMGLLLPGGAVSSEPTITSSSSKRIAGADMTIEKPPEPEVPPASSQPTSSQPGSSQPGSSQPGSSQPASSQPTGSNCSNYGVSSGAKYYTQFDSAYKEIQWKGGVCPNCKIYKSGCPMIAILNSINKVTNCNLTPKMFADHMKSYTNNFNDRKGLFSSNSEWSNLGEPIVKHYASYYKVNIKSISKGSVKTALQAGHAVVARGARGSNNSNKVFSANGHYVAFTAISGNTITVRNPASSSFKSVSFETATAYATNYYEVWK